MSIYFKERFKNLRKSRDLTQEQIAEIFHVSPQSVSRWETGVNYPDIEILPHIAVFFHVTVDELLGTEDVRGEADAKNYTKDIRNLLNSGKLDDAIETARQAVKQYPLNTRLHYLLVQALSTANNAHAADEKYKDEIIAISERMINLTDYNASLEHRVQLIRQYAKWGMREDAKRILDTLPTEIWNTQEPWSGLVLDDDAWLQNQKHRMIRASYLLDYLISGYAHHAGLPPLKKIQSLKAQMQMMDLINTITSDNPAGEVIHLEVAMGDIVIAELYSGLGDHENALAHVEKATQHAAYHMDHMDKTNEDDGGNYMPWETPRNLPWILWEDHLTKTAFDPIRQDERFVKCFGKLQANSRELK